MTNPGEVGRCDYEKAEEGGNGRPLRHFFLALDYCSIVTAHPLPSVNMSGIMANRFSSY